MEKIRCYLQASAKKVADRSGKPLTLIAAMAFLFTCIVLLPLAGLSVTANLLINAAIATVTLLLVLILITAHGKEIRGLQARLDEFAAHLQTISGLQEADRFSPAEVQQIRALIAEQATACGETVRRVKRDQRPSLF